MIRIDVYSKYTSYAQIDLDSIAHNVRMLVSHVGPDVELWAVVKANAYGHGAVQVARTALACGAKRLAVARIDEGIVLRKAGLHAPILVMGYAVPTEAEAMVDYDLIATVNTAEAAQALSRRAVALGKIATVHIKVDTGMGRYGLLPDEVLAFVEQVSRLHGLDLEGLYTHFATADQADKTYTYRQLTTFKEVARALRAAGYTIRLHHAANSAATLDLPETHLDAVRVGIAIYGLRPSDELEPKIPLKAALSLKSRIARLRTLPPGSSISYGQTYVTSRPTPVALVPIGYGDGYHRSLSNRGQVLVGGRRVPIVGRVCMDQFVVDVTGIEGVQQDDEVVLIGVQGEEHIPAEELAALAGTNNYEIVTGLLPRIPRIYLRGGEVTDVEGLLP